MVCCCTSTPWRRDRTIQALAIFGVCVAMCTLDFAFDRSRARLEAPASSHISAGAAGGALLPTRAVALPHHHSISPTHTPPTLRFTHAPTDAFHVENALANDPNYVPGCNIGAASCTKVFKSSYAHILSHFNVVEKGSAFDLSLATSGMALYSGFFLYPILRKIPARHHILMFVSLGSICFSCYLLYVLHTKLHEFCIVCTTFHTINFTMCFFCISEWRFRQAKLKTS